VRRAETQLVELGGNTVMEDGRGPGPPAAPPAFVRSAENLSMDAVPSTSGSQQDPEAILAEKVRATTGTDPTEILCKPVQTHDDVLEAARRACSAHGCAALV
jgi:hypothetical protein